VDNLAPPTPSPFTAEYSAGATALHWGRSPAPDFAEYRIYRGTSPSFVPRIEMVLATPTDTGYVDPAGQPYYYKLSAVDVHGNESPYALAQPEGPVDVEDAAPGPLRLGRATPNPARVAAEIHFELSRAERARLAVYDLAGREVRVLDDGVLTAGAHTGRWDLRDARGRAVAGGLYFYRLSAEGRELAGRIAVTH
jgi:hypothetical protein